MRRRKIHYLSPAYAIKRGKRNVPMAVSITDIGLEVIVIRRGHTSVAKIIRWTDLANRVQIERKATP